MILNQKNINQYIKTVIEKLQQGSYSGFKLCIDYTGHIESIEVMISGMTVRIDIPKGENND